jgi:uncharacterized protein YdiU (UPF0061 family)
MTSSEPSSTKLQIQFDNRNIQSLPIDASNDPSSRKTPNVIFSLVQPTPVSNPSLVAYSRDALELIGIKSTERENDADFVASITNVLSGNEIPAGAVPYSHCYCGHQFGSFAGQLGDGAAIYLGEVTSESGNRWELQLKGAGPTPYSRSSDGRKVLRSSIREFLCSEAMHFLVSILLYYV